MKTITIHDIDENLAILLQSKARQEGLSIDKTVKKILRDALTACSENIQPENNFLDLCGAWSEQDLREFENASKDFEQISPEDWR